jgi:hypothetical protein
VGSFLIVPVVVVAMLAVILVYMAAGRGSKARKADATLPEEPAARRDEEVRRLKQEHAESESPASRG